MQGSWVCDTSQDWDMQKRRPRSQREVSSLDGCFQGGSARHHLTPVPAPRDTQAADWVGLALTHQRTPESGFPTQSTDRKAGETGSQRSSVNTQDVL